MNISLSIYPTKKVANDSFFFLFLRCAPDWESNKHIVYTFYWLVTGFLGPLAIIIFSSCKTIIQMKKVRKKQE